MINTFCKFYYGHTINQDNRYLDFQEFGGSALLATLKIGEYSLTDFCNEVARAMNEVGSQSYAVSANRTTRIITVTAPTTTFKLLPVTGSNEARSCYDLLGFSSDTSYALSQVGDSASGYEWVPQFKPQSYVDFEHQQLSVDGVVKQSTSGAVEAVKFGNFKIMECNFKFITNIYQSQLSPISNDSQGVENAIAFLEYIITKADLEFIPDKNDASAYHKCLLESTEESKDGLSFKLKEQYASGLVGYYETGILKFRKI
jgi:hypothetical protein